MFSSVAWVELDTEGNLFVIYYMTCQPLLKLTILMKSGVWYVVLPKLIILLFWYRCIWWKLLWRRSHQMDKTQLFPAVSVWCILHICRTTKHGSRVSQTRVDGKIPYLSSTHKTLAGSEIVTKCQNPLNLH